MIISLLMESFPLAFLSFSSLIPFEIISIVNGKSRIASCFLLEGILLLPSSLFLSFSLTLNKLGKRSTHFFGGIESTWFELLFAFPLSLLIYCQKSLGLLDKHSNTLMFSIFHFCLIVLMVCLYFLLFCYTGLEYKNFKEIFEHV